MQILNAYNTELAAELPLLTIEELSELARYAKFLRWSRDFKSDWADAPLCDDEEIALERGRENARVGNYMTLSEFRESV